MNNKFGQIERAQEIKAYLQAHDGKVTAKQAADALNSYTSTIYRAAKKHNISLIPDNRGRKVKVSLGVRSKYCANRPESCFECPFDDCYCSDAMNEEEALQFVKYHGTGKGEAKIR